MQKLESCGGLSTKDAEEARLPSGETGADGSFENESEIIQSKAYDEADEAYIPDVLQFLDEEETNKADEKGKGIEMSDSQPGVSAPFAPPSENPEIFEAYMKILNYLQATGQLLQPNQQKIKETYLSDKDPSEHGTNDTYSQVNFASNQNTATMQENLAGLANLTSKEAKQLRKKARRMARLSLNSPSPSTEFDGDSMSHIAQQINPLGMPMTLETLQMCIQAIDQVIQGGQPATAEAPREEEIVDEEAAARRKKLREAMFQRRKEKTARPPRVPRDHPHLDRETLDKVVERHKEEEGMVEFRQGSEAPASLFHPFKPKEVSKYLWARRLFGLSESGLFGAEEHEPDQQKFEACMMFVSGYDSKAFKINELSNIFSNYGNVSYAICFQDANAAFIKYTVPETAAIAHKHLTKKSLAGHKVNIVQFSHFEGLDPCFLYCQPEVFVPRSTYRRFKQDIPKILNPISSCLHVCIFFPRKRRTVGDLEIVRFMKKSGVNPIQVKRDVTNTHINMWFVEYERSTDAVLTLMKLHDLRFEDGRVRISFTKSSKDDNNELLVDILAAAEAEDIEQDREHAQALVKQYLKSNKLNKKSDKAKKGEGKSQTVGGEIYDVFPHNSGADEDDRIPLMLEKARTNKKKKKTAAKKLIERMITDPHQNELQQSAEVVDFQKDTVPF